MKDLPAGEKIKNAEARIVSFGAIAMDLVFRKLCIEGNQYPLSPKEFMIMYMLLERKGALVRRAELCKAIGTPVDGTALENHIHRLRKKLDKHGSLLVSKRSYGYRIALM